MSETETPEECVFRITYNQDTHYKCRYPRDHKGPHGDGTMTWTFGAQPSGAAGPTMSDGHGCSCAPDANQRFPHVTYDLGAYAVSVVTESCSRIARTVELTPEGYPFTVMLDVDETGDIVGVEVLMARPEKAENHE